MSDSPDKAGWRDSPDSPDASDSPRSPDRSQKAGSAGSARLARFTAMVACAGWLAGCGSAKGENDIPALLNQRLIGMPAGEFFDRYGPANTRTVGDANTAIYDWESDVGYARPGPNGLDTRVCRLTITVSKALRISAVEVVLDMEGVTSTSRCREIFDAKEPGPLLQPPRRVSPT